MDSTLKLNLDNNFISKNEVELIQQQEIESLIINTFTRTNGLQLFGWSRQTDKVLMIQLAPKNKDLQLVIIDGVLKAEESKLEYETQLDNTLIYFEALNLESAKRRVQKYKEGKIHSLFNLKQRNGSIKFW